ncbi:MAG: hypothetical protein QOH57_4877 [Mycobacterium sp.]|nr:hypothetical protein [Mycobacterium sp.]
MSRRPVGCPCAPTNPRPPRAVDQTIAVRVQRVSPTIVVIGVVDVEAGMIPINRFLFEQAHAAQLGKLLQGQMSGMAQVCDQLLDDAHGLPILGEATRDRA